MIYRAYFRLPEGRFRHFRRPVGKQVFSVIPPAPSSRPSKSGNPLLLQRNLSRSVPLMSAYVYQPVFSLLEAYWSWTTFWIAVTGMAFFTVISWFGLTVPAVLRLVRRLIVGPIRPAVPVWKRRRLA